MAANYDTAGIEKEFGHCKITWKFENYFFMTFHRNWFICGPEIYVKNPATKWKMTLKPDEINMNTVAPSYKTTGIVNFRLQRLDLEAGPDTVQVQWRLSIKNKHGEKKLLSDRKFNFNRTGWCFQEIPNGDILNVLHESGDTWSIICQLIVSHKEDASGKSKKFKGNNFEKSIQDLREILQARSRDILIKNKGRTMEVQKAVPNRATRPIILELDDNAFVKAVLYLYTNDYILQEAFSLFECLHRFDVKKAMKYYVVDKVTWSTTPNVQAYLFRWIIENVSDRTDNTVTSPIWYDGVSGTCWQMQLQLEQMEEHIRMSVSAEGVGNMNHIIVDFFAMDDDGNIIERSICNCFRKENDVTINNILQRESLPSLPKDTLHIIAKINVLLNAQVTADKTQISSANAE